MPYFLTTFRFSWSCLFRFCFHFVSSETKRFCFSFRGERFTQSRLQPIRVKSVIGNLNTGHFQLNQKFRNFRKGGPTIETFFWNFPKVQNCLIFETRIIQPRVSEIVGRKLNGTENLGKKVSKRYCAIRHRRGQVSESFKPEFLVEWTALLF